MEKFVTNGDHVNTHSSNVMNWMYPDPVHSTVSMCVKENDVTFGAIVNDVDIVFSALHIKAIVL